MHWLLRRNHDVAVMHTVVLGRGRWSHLTANAIAQWSFASVIVQSDTVLQD